MHFTLMYRCTLTILFLWLFTLTYCHCWQLITDINVSRKVIMKYGPWIFTKSMEYTHIYHAFIFRINERLRSSLACWPLLPKIAGYFGRKIPQHAFLRRGSKAVCPMSQICGMWKNPAIYLEVEIADHINRPFLARNSVLRWQGSLM
jgi:hypothetical protein